MLFYWTAGLETRLWAFSGGGKSFPFPEISGWKQSGEMQIFPPRNLYEYIDGGADLYLKYDFQELKVAEYQNDKKASVTVEIYRHKTPTHTFGIYSQERLANANFLDIGAQGYIEKDTLNFLQGNYYVKISCYNAGPDGEGTLLTFAKRVGENLGEKDLLPSILSSFPREGKKKNTEKYIAKNFLGYSFLHSVFTADYEHSGKKFNLFVIEGTDQNDCKNMIEKYLQYIKSPGKDMSEGRYLLSDRHHGEIEVYWKRDYIWGAMNLEDPALRAEYLELFEKGLFKK